MIDKKAVFINTASQIFVRIATLFFGLISVKLLSNYLGPAGTGEYNTINTYINFFIVVADLGLFSVTVREIAKKPEQEKQIISNVFVIRLVTALIAALVASGLIFLTKYDNNIKFGTLVASGYIFMNLLASVYDMILQYRLKMQYSALAEFISKMITILALLFIIRLQGNFLLVASTITLAGVVIFIVKWLFARCFLSFRPQYDKKIASWIFSLSWPIGIVFIINNLYFKIDTLILFAVKGAAPVGIYSVAYKVLEVTAVAGAYFASALKPTISTDIISDRERLAGVISKSFTIMLLMAAPITVLSVIFSKEIILLLSNADFLSGYRALMILAFTLPVIYLDTLLGEILIANDERKFLTKVSIFILSFNLILNLIFIPRYSFIGASITTLISETVLFIVNSYYAHKIVPYRINYTHVVKILAVSLLTALLGLSLKLTSIHFIPEAILTALAFALFAYAAGLINLKLVREIVKR